LSNLSENVTLTCPNNLTIAIITADFGRDMYSMSCDGKRLEFIKYIWINSINMWKFIQDKYHTSGDCTSRASTTEKARELCQGKQNCVMNANIDVFTDPCPYVIKQLRVWYQCISTPGFNY
jgi:hypothetical protein